jgi:spermidine synthase
MYLPDVRLDAVEVDPLVVELARKHFGFTTSPNATLAVTDGRQYLRQNKLKYDQIWVDTFNSDYIPTHMTTKEFLELAKSRLTEQGVVVQNVHKGNRLYDAHVATFRSAFKHVFIFTGRGGNAILVGAENPAHMPEGFASQAARFNGKIGKIDLLEEAGKLDPGFDVRPAKVLTDDYAPANLLLHRK